MMMPKKGGSAPIEHLKSVAEQTGILPVELEEFYSLEVPEDFIQFYDDFLSVSRRRPVSEFGVSPLSYQEIDCWARLHNVELSQLHIEAICMLDSTWLRVYSTKNN